MKKFVAVLSAAAMLATLAACGSTAATSTAASSADTAAASSSEAAAADDTAKSYKIAVVQSWTPKPPKRALPLSTKILTARTTLPR